MTRARKQLIDLATTPYYHCICRCVRRAFLCGEDHLTGKNYEHRKDWVVQRLTELAQVFAIEVCAYAVMSNHYHVVLRVDQDKALTLSEEQVLARWERLFKVPLIVEQYQSGTAVSRAVEKKAQEIIEEWRQRLMDISWYMRTLNEHLARRANEEDRCRGRFWEGRYKSQALLDDAAVLTCMSYVDLNPIRARISETPEASDYTSIQQRIRQWQRTPKTKTKTETELKQTPIPLMPLVKQSQDPHKNTIGYTRKDYIELVDWAGRAIREDKRGHIPNDIPPILQRLNLRAEAYLSHVGRKTLKTTQLKRLPDPKALGSVARLKALAEKLEQTFIRGIGDARRLYRIAE